MINKCANCCRGTLLVFAGDKHHALYLCQICNEKFNKFVKRIYESNHKIFTNNDRDIRYMLLGGDFHSVHEMVIIFEIKYDGLKWLAGV